MTDQLTSEYLADQTGHDVNTIPPLPVVVTAPVRVEDRPARSFTAQQVAVSDVAQRVAADSPSRAELRLVNLGPGPIYVAPAGHSATRTTGYPLNVDAELVLSTVSEVWAATDPGGSATLGMLAQYRDG